MNNLTEKKCTKCGEVKDLSAFAKGNRCKKCKSIYDSQYIKAHPERIKIIVKKSNLKNKDKIKESQRIWRENNKERCIEWRIKYMQNPLHKEAQYKLTKQWHINNKEKVRELQKQWNVNNREKRLEQYRKCNIKDSLYLSDTYILNKLKLKRSECPQSLIEIERARIQLKRLIKELN